MPVTMSHPSIAPLLVTSPRLATPQDRIPCWQFAHSISGLPVVTNIPAIKEVDPKV